MNEPIKQRDKERFARIKQLAKQVFGEDAELGVDLLDWSMVYTDKGQVLGVDHPRALEVLEVALDFLAGGPQWADQLADAWESHARRLDPIHKDRASTYQDCADELRERAKGEP